MTQALPEQIVDRPTTAATIAGLAAPARRLPAADIRLIAEAGRAALIWFGLFVLYAGEHLIDADALIAISCATVVWSVTLRSIPTPARLVLGRPLAATFGAAFGLVIVTGLNRSTVGLHAPPMLLVAATAGVLLSVLVWDAVVERAAVFTQRVLVVGGEGFPEVDEERSACRRAGFDPIAVVAFAPELAEIVRAHEPDLVVLTDDASYDAALERLMDAHANVRVAGLPSFCELALGRIPIDRIGSAWFMSLFHPRQRIYARFTKRAFDVVVAVVGLIVAAPLMAVITALIRLTPGPVLYRQTRVGADGGLFTITKFRTMRRDAENDGAVWAQENDPRTTRLGAVLRRTHLDELPQLWNVLRGEMSIVGPRPERPEFIAALDAAVPFWSRRLLVKPGVTGWAQIRCGYASDHRAMVEKLSYDLWYVRNRSLLVDLALCVKTVTAVLSRSPASGR